MVKKSKNILFTPLSLKNIFNPREYLKNLLNGNKNLQDTDYGFYVEDYFHKVFTLERRRTERSRKPFLLMLINIHDLIKDNGDVSFIRKIATVLQNNTREVDIKGWYKSNYIIGIIFTEPADIDVEFIKHKIIDKLRGALGRESTDKIKLSFSLFPQRFNKQRDIRQQEPDSELHSDLAERGSSRTALFLKRTLDIIGGASGILIFSPFMLIIPILVKISSDGPVFFKQERLGQGGKTFTFLKFRTMYVNNDSSIHQEFVKELICNNNGSNGEGRENSKKNGVFKIENDPRVTPLGRFLRKTSLDEIPQFFNILKGDMSLVGPRPPIPYELENYDSWHYRRVLDIKPGLTGYWQVHGRSSTTFDEMVRMDINYIRNRSILLDIKLLCKTPLVVLTGKGAH